MTDFREEYFDKTNKVSIITVDVSSAAQALARGHLCGPTSAYFLARACAAVALLGSEMSEKDETVILQMKCKGPLGGFNVECTAQGTLRGYTEKKTLDAFDGLGRPDPKMVIGDKQIQVTRSIPGKILSQGISNSLDGYLAGSLQRKAVIFTEAEVDDDVNVKSARGIMVEALPDSKASIADYNVDAASLPRDPNGGLDLSSFELRRTQPLKFACRCSPDRALAMLSAMSEAERATLPESIDITCHMCGRTFTVHR